MNTGGTNTTTAAGPYPHPVAVMSFDRPHYLEQVLRSLIAQTVPIRQEQVALFQDGYRAKNGEDITDPRLIERSVELFHTIVPGGRVFYSNENLGVAWNFARAEKYMFDELEAEAGCFFEDDLILSPHYLAVLQTLTQIALDEKRIAYVAAYGNHRANIAEQSLTPCKLILMHHKWGFILTRRQWAAQREILAPYLDIVSHADYRFRDHEAIRAYFRKLGYGSAGTSQDGMKDVASCILGTTKIMTFPCFGKYIGEVGLHSTKSLYDAEKLDETEIYPEAVLSFEAPSGEQLEKWIADGRVSAQRALAGATKSELPLCPPITAGGERSDSLEARSETRKRYRAQSAGFQSESLLKCSSTKIFPRPSRVSNLAIVGEQREWTERVNTATTETSADGMVAMPDFTLWMASSETRLFVDFLNEAACYLEYGAGGSTLAAVRSPIKQIVSVETDSAWVERLMQHEEIATAVATKRLTLRHVDVGPVGEWGVPKSEARIRNWPRYAIEPFVSTDFNFDAILIDGRFRLHCLLAIVSCAAPTARIFLHDYQYRHEYTIADKYFDTIDRVESSVILKIRDNINLRSLYIDLIHSLFTI